MSFLTEASLAATNWKSIAALTAFGVACVAEAIPTSGEISPYKDVTITGMLLAALAWFVRENATQRREHRDEIKALVDRVNASQTARETSHAERENRLTETIIEAMRRMQSHMIETSAVKPRDGRPGAD